MENGEQFLERIASSDISSEDDDIKMNIILKKVGFPKAIVTCGIVYIDGRGTMDFPPMLLSQIAQILLKKLKEGVNDVK